MFKGQRITRLENDVQVLRRTLEYYKDTKTSLQSEIRDSFNRELAQYRAAVQGTITDKIKFDVLEEWINEVFKLNNLKFSEKDFIQHNERTAVEAEIREQIAKEIEDYRLERAEELSISPAAFPRIQVALAKLVREPK